MSRHWERAAPPLNVLMGAFVGFKPKASEPVLDTPEAVLSEMQRLFGGLSG